MCFLLAGSWEAITIVRACANLVAISRTREIPPRPRDHYAKHPPSKKFGAVGDYLQSTELRSVQRGQFLLARWEFDGC